MRGAPRRFIQDELWPDDAATNVAGPLLAHPGKQKPRLSGAFLRLRGKDSNLDYLVQSQASYH
jgi:hypothetical protein